MFNQNLFLLALFAAVDASFEDDISAVSSQAAALSSMVNGFDGSGLSGALGIQESYGPFSSAVAQLASDAGAAQASDITSGNISALNSMVGSLSGLLDALTSKASEFTKVGASQIVQGDINNLVSPSESIVSDLVKLGQSNCDAISSLAGPVASLSSAFNAAAASYSGSSVSFVDVKCEGGSGGGSSAAAGSSGAAMSSEAAMSSGAAMSSEAAMSSGAAMSSMPAEASGSSSGPAQANGAIAVGAGFAAAAAGVAALLM